MCLISGPIPDGRNQLCRRPGQRLAISLFVSAKWWRLVALFVIYVVFVANTYCWNAVWYIQHKYYIIQIHITELCDFHMAAVRTHLFCSRCNCGLHWQILEKVHGPDAAAFIALQFHRQYRPRYVQIRSHNNT